MMMMMRGTVLEFMFEKCRSHINCLKDKVRYLNAETFTVHIDECASPAICECDPITVESND